MVRDEVVKVSWGHFVVDFVFQVRSKAGDFSGNDYNEERKNKQKALGLLA